MRRKKWILSIILTLSLLFITGMMFRFISADSEKSALKDDKEIEYIEEQYSGRYTSTFDLNTCKKPSIDYEVIGQLSPGDFIEVLARAKNVEKP